MDVFPTFLEAARITMTEGRKLDGVSLLPLLTRRANPPERAFFWTFWMEKQRAARQGDWKLYVKDTEPPQLFNLRDDIAEKNDLSPREPARVKSLMAALTAWEEDMRVSSR
jgi:arylsulfatase A-like enzyme